MPIPPLLIPSHPFAQPLFKSFMFSVARYNYIAVSLLHWMSTVKYNYIKCIGNLIKV